MNNLQKWIPLVIAITCLILIAGWFYWFQYRPGQIKKECAQKALEAVKLTKQQYGDGSGSMMIFINKYYEDAYKVCLHSNGL